MIELAGRKARLLGRCQGDRTTITVAFRRWEVPARHVDRAVATVQALRAHPVLVGIAVLVPIVLGRRRLVTWASRGMLAWRAWRGLLGWMRRFST